MKNKEANFQILKIAAMLMIVSHHLVAKNAFNIDTQVIGITGNKLALQILGNNAFIGNNLFFLVSAWFLSKKPDEKVDLNYSTRSCWKIEKTVLFYGLSMCIGAFIFGGGAEQNITAPICISNTDRNVVVPNNVHDFSFDLAFLSQSTYGVLCGCPKAVYDSHACDLECFNNCSVC